MAGRIKKRQPAPATDQIKKTAPHDGKVVFSFTLFDSNDQELCPCNFPDGYTITLMERLSGISKMTDAEFRSTRDKALRIHTHEWPQTIRPDGFQNLNEQLRDYPGWQFCLTANAHGRVHGIMIDNVFYVIWLDLNHALYPKKD